ncbi:MAG: 50S ribosomal protein L11 methyltransferase [Proteobacteria bacterium]|nr:50S ribosomal protein L11 methyltransferase [Pseudomonadota bacterium]
MEWRQFVMNLESIEPDRLEEVLLRHGAQSLTLSDAGDDPVLEPEPGAAPLWSTTRMTALFAANADFERLRTDLEHTLAIDTLPRNRVELLTDRAWEREWLKDFVPMRFGERLWVSPAGLVVDADDAVVVRLDPGLAFGTGTHATTALCLEWLDKIEIAGKTLLDFGCGSGILAIAGLKLGATSVTALDIDRQAITATRQNALSNDVDNRLVTTMQMDLLDDQFDFVVANILAGTLIDHAGFVCDRLRPGGRLALSGILAEQVADVTAAYQHCVEFGAADYRDNWARLSGTRTWD